MVPVAGLEPATFSLQVSSAPIAPHRHWSGIRESNPPLQLGRLRYYRCTNTTFGVSRGSRTLTLTLARLHSAVKLHPHWRFQ